jgi:hypothetical protein
MKGMTGARSETLTSAGRRQAMKNPLHPHSFPASPFSFSDFFSHFFLFFLFFVFFGAELVVVGGSVPGD